MGQITHLILVVRVLLVSGSTLDRGSEPTGKAKTTFGRDVDEEVGLLCDELEEQKYSLNKTLFKLKVLPVESWWSQEKVSSLWSVGLFSSSLKMSDEQLLQLLTPQWVEDEFEKEQKKKPKKKKIVIPQNPLQVNALVVVDKALDNMVANSTKFVQDFFPLVNHVLRSVGLEIRIKDILAEGSERSFGLIQPLDNKQGLAQVYKPSQAFQWEVQKTEHNHDVILMLSGLDICDRTDSADQPFSCSLLGIAGPVVTAWPFFRRHDCGYKTAIIEVPKPEDRIGRWSSAIVTAHEVVHLIGRTNHDGEKNYLGGGPAGESCKGFNHHIMSPDRDMTELYRVCMDLELWSKCTMGQVKFYTANWTQFCPGSFFTLHENPLYALLILPLADILALVYFCYKKRSRRMKKLLEDETERLKAEAFAQSGGAFRDHDDAKHDIEDVKHNIADTNHNIGGANHSIGDANHNHQDSIHENSLLAGTQDTEIEETLF